MTNAPGSRLQAPGKRTFAFEDLEVWKQSISFATEVYRAAQSFPKEELYGLTSQIRRSAASIAANIAEGKGRYSKKDFRHFLFTARGSLYEVVTHLQLSERLGYLESDRLARFNESAHEIISKLSGLIHSLEDPMVSEPLEPIAWSLEP